MGNFSAFPLRGSSLFLPELAYTPSSYCWAQTRQLASPAFPLVPLCVCCFVSPLLKLIMFSGQVPQAITTKGK